MTRRSIRRASRYRRRTAALQLARPPHDGGLALRDGADHAVDVAARPPAGRQPVGPGNRHHRPRPHAGRSAEIRPCRLAGRPGMGKPRSRPTLPQYRQSWRGGSGRRPHGIGRWRHRRLLLLRNVGRATRDRIIAEQTEIRPIASGAARLIRPTSTRSPRWREMERCRFIDETGGLAISARARLGAIRLIRW